MSYDSNLLKLLLLTTTHVSNQWYLLFNTY